MKVLLVHVDGKMPNLALMKISAWHKKQGDEVFLKRGLTPILPLECPDPDKVYISCIFGWNRERALRLAENLEKKGFKVEVGGYGINDEKLPVEIEHIRPDYDLYGIDYSMGYTSRGCIRKCPWCLVWRREGYIREHADIKEFLHPHHRKVILFDNNLLAAPNCEKVLLDLIAYRLKVNFTQGLDIRLIDREKARLLSKIHYYDWRFKNRRLHFAFDLPEIEDEVIRGIRLLEKARIPRRHLMFYVLVGYNTSYEEDMHRINLLIKEGVRPYVMPYNNRHDSYYVHLERWVNWRYYEVVRWEKYDHGNSQKVITGLAARRLSIE